MFNSTSFNRTIVCLVITFLFVLHTINKIEIPLLNKVENSVYDLRLKLTMPSTIDRRIVILDIDDKSLAQEGRWPWSRDKMSYLTDILFDYYQVSVLGFDIVFAEPDISSGLGILENLSQNELKNNSQFKNVYDSLKPQLKFDDLFANSLKNRNVVLGYYFNTTGNINPSSHLPKPALPLTQQPLLKPFKASGFGGNLTTLQDAAIYGGYFNNQSVDSDGSFRRLPLVTAYQDHIYESLSLAVYRKLLNQPPLNFTFENGFLESIDIESLRIPVNENAVALVPFRGNQGSFKYISATDILNAEIDPNALAGKIVLMGATAAGILDLRTTPVQNVYPGVEIHANLISAMLDNSFKSRPTYMMGAEFLELIFLAALVIFLYPKLSSTFSALTFSLLITLMVSANLYLWNHFHIDNFLATPLIFLFILFSIQIYFGYFLETKKKKKLGKIFGQYIPEKLVADMSQSEHEYSLKGESKEMTVLFSDVRNFTTISENMKPEELCDLINEILTPITKVIHHNKGTIDKYIGDAVMAFWGAPLTDKNHAFNSVKAALEFIPALERINQSFQKKNWPHIDIGIGINTGIMNVGNMGSEFRMAYTVMGDTVNLGSRLEGLTKQYGVRIIVSEFTKQVTPEFLYLKLDCVKVKGKTKPVTIYEPLCIATESTEAVHQKIEQFDKAFNYYLEQNWQQAHTIITMLHQQYPDKLLFQLYLERINEYIETPPDSNWDGVFTYSTK